MAGSSSTPVLDPELWGPPVPHPPHGLSPVELKEWVDNFVCEWAEAYGSSNSKDTKGKRRSSGGRPLSQGETLGSWGQMETAPGQSSTESASSPTISSPTQVPVAVIPPDLMHVPQHSGMRRSVSYPNTIDTFASSAGPSDMSSVASWDSLDSWEMERRQNYEEPRRRNDFMPLPSVRLVGPRHRNRERQDIASTEDDHIYANGGDEVPSIVVTAFGDSEQFSSSVLDAVDGMGPLTASVSRSEGHGDRARVNSGAIEGNCGASSSLEHHRVTAGGTTGQAENEIPVPSLDEDEDAVVFFPRPLGAELPGTGLARSPHIEGLSRFSGSGTVKF